MRADGGGSGSSALVGPGGLKGGVHDKRGTT